MSECWNEKSTKRIEKFLCSNKQLTIRIRKLIYSKAKSGSSMDGLKFWRTGFEFFYSLLSKMHLIGLRPSTYSCAIPIPFTFNLATTNLSKCSISISIPKTRSILPAAIRTYTKTLIRTFTKTFTAVLKLNNHFWQGFIMYTC